MFDRVARYLMRQYVAGLLGWLLGLAPQAFRFVGWLDTRVGTAGGAPERTADTLARVVSLPDGRPRAVLVEFQIDPDAEMFGRVLEHLGGAWRREKPNELPGDRYWVGAVVVNLRGRGDTSRQLAWEEAGLETTLKVREWNLAELDAERVMEEVRSGATPAAVLAFIPLMKKGGEAGIIQGWLEFAGRQADARLRSDLGLAHIFADAAGCGPAWKEALKGWDMHESAWLKEVEKAAEDRGMERGRKKGREEGMSHGQATAVVAILEARFGAVPADLSEVVMREESREKLTAWLRLAATAESLDAFRQAAGI